MQAFASEPVFKATQASSTAHISAMGVIKSREDAKPSPPTPSDEAVEALTPITSGFLKSIEVGELKAASEVAERAGKYAEKADDTLVELIRSELQDKKGRPLADWQAFRTAD